MTHTGPSTDSLAGKERIHWEDLEADTENWVVSVWVSSLETFYSKYQYQYQFLTPKERFSVSVSKFEIKGKSLSLSLKL